MFAAARGAGKVLVIEASSTTVATEVLVGLRPSGLAWDPGRRRLLVADVEDMTGRLIDPASGSLLQLVTLPGRPRWAVYDAPRDRFLVNIREPAVVLLLAGEDGARIAAWPVSSDGPHGLDVDVGEGKAFVACDGARVGARPCDGNAARACPHRRRARRGVGQRRPSSSLCLYVAIGKPGVIDVLETRSLTPVEMVTTEEGAHTTAFDRRRGRLYAFLPRTSRAAVYEDV